MVPPFGFIRSERIALGIFVLSGIIGLTLYPFELFSNAAIGREAVQIAETYLWVPGKIFLVVQGSLVILTAPGALLRSFTIVAAGILAGLVFITPIGALTALPAIGMLFLVLRKLRSFREFMPQWKGHGTPPPGNWR